MIIPIICGSQYSYKQMADDQGIAPQPRSNAEAYMFDNRAPTGRASYDDQNRDDCSQSMLTSWQNDLLEKVKWAKGRIPQSSGDFPDIYNNDGVHVLECWKYEGVDTVLRAKNWRTLDLSDTPQNSSAPEHRRNEFEDRLQCWLDRRRRYEAPKPDEAGDLKGGLRLVMCERPNMRPKMTMSRKRLKY